MHPSATHGRFPYAIKGFNSGKVNTSRQVCIATCSLQLTDSESPERPAIHVNELIIP